MQYRHELRYPRPPADVYAMLADVAFREQVCAELGATRHDAAVEPTDNGMTVTVRQTMPVSDSVPAFARGFTGAAVDVVQEERWASRERAALALTVPGKPARFTGSITLRADGAGTVETVEGTVTVSIPLIGGRLEGLLAQVIDNAITVEGRIGAKRLAG